MEKIEQQEPTEKIEIEGIGSIEIFGELNIEKFVKRMLQSKAITE